MIRFVEYTTVVEGLRVVVLPMLLVLVMVVRRVWPASSTVEVFAVAVTVTRTVLPFCVVVLVPITFSDV